MNKYKNISRTVGSFTFNSFEEAERYKELRLLEKAGKIKDLQIQPVFILQERFETKAGKTIRPIRYIADFQYTENGQTVVEDIKRNCTDVFIIKRKLFLYKFPDIIFRITQ